MRVVINTQLLVSELRLITKIVPTKPSLPIFSHVLFDAHDDRLSFYATDTEIGLSTVCDARVELPGRAVLPAHKLLALVEQFTDTTVTLSHEGAKMLVSSGAFHSRLQTLSDADYPAQPTPTGTPSLLSASTFGSLLDRTRYAVAAEQTKYILRGALLTLDGTDAKLVATDGKRLALAKTSSEAHALQMIVPLKTMDILADLMLDGHDVELTVNEHRLFFGLHAHLLMSRAIDGEFPKYERIIPRTHDRIVSFQSDQMSAALRRVIVVADEKLNAVKFTIMAGRIELSSTSVDVGSAHEAITATYDGEQMSLFVNGEYVLDFLNAAKGPTIVMALKESAPSMLLTDGPDHIAVIMSMRG